MDNWEVWQKLVLYRLKENHKDNKAIREAVERIDRRIVHLETRDKIRAGFISAVVSCAAFLIQRLF